MFYLVGESKPSTVKVLVKIQSLLFINAYWSWFAPKKTICIYCYWENITMNFQKCSRMCQQAESRWNDVNLVVLMIQLNCCSGFPTSTELCPHEIQKRNI